MLKKLHHIYSRVLRIVVPIGVVAGLGYLSFVLTKILVIDEVIRQRHNMAAAVVILVIEYFILLQILINWVMTFVNGPGIIQQKISPYRLVTFVDPMGHEIEPENKENHKMVPNYIPPYFLCDINGYPYYCPTCQSIKPLRTRHSSELNKCVAKMDHHCVWIGSIFGKNNYKNFFLYSLFFLLYFLVYFIVLLVFIPHHVQRRLNEGSHINPNLAIVLTASTFWTVVLLAHVFQHSKYISRNETTIEHIHYQRGKKIAKLLAKKKSLPSHLQVESKKKTYVNILHNSERYVLEVSPMSTPFKQSSFIANLKQVAGPNPLTWLLPFNFANSKIIDLESCISPSETLSCVEKTTNQSPFSDSTKANSANLHSHSQNWLLDECFGDEFLQSLHKRISEGEGVKFQSEVIVTA